MFRGWRVHSSVQLTSQGGPGHLARKIPLSLPFPGQGFFGGVLGYRRGPNLNQQWASRAGMFEPWYPRESECGGEHSLSPQVSDSFLPSPPSQPTLTQLCARRTCVSVIRFLPPSLFLGSFWLPPPREDQSLQALGSHRISHSFSAWVLVYGEENKPSSQEESTWSVESCRFL